MKNINKTPLTPRIFFGRKNPSQPSLVREGVSFPLTRGIKGVSSQNKKAFTLVELIIVITILAILATIGFIAFQSYIGDSRDANRISTLKNIEKGLTLYSLKTKKYPEPESYVEILGTGSSILIKQGIVGGEISRVINLNKLPKDPSDETNYIYSTSGNRKKYQLGTYLESEDFLLSVVPQTYANIDYTNRYFYTIGNKVGILLEDETQNPILKTQTLTGINLETNTGSFKVYFSNDTQSGSITSSSHTLITTITETQKTTQTYTCTGSLVSANANITNTTGLTADTAYQTSNPSNSCYYTCKTGYGEENCQTNLNVMNENTCQTLAGWIWVDATTDTIGDGFCISPRVSGGTKYISWMDIGTFRSWTRTNVSPMTASPAYADNKYGVTYDLGNYTCEALGTGNTDVDSTYGDTLVGRMKWLNTNRTNSTELDNIDWVSVPSKPATFSVPAIMLADCIDGVRNLQTGYDYEGVTYSQFSSPTNDLTGRQNMNKYLLGWTKASGSHLPSAYDDISKETTDMLTTNKGEYQIACDAGKFGTVSNPGGNATGSQDDTVNQRIWLSSVGSTDGSQWGLYARLVGAYGCGDQDTSSAGTRNISMSARFVVR